MKKYLKIAFSDKASEIFEATFNRSIIPIHKTDFTDVAAIIITTEEQNILENKDIQAFGIPVFLILKNNEKITDYALGKVFSLINLKSADKKFYVRQIESAADKYEESMLPPFLGKLMRYVEKGNSAFDCPGHQGGDYFKKHPTGRLMYNFYGENTFRADLCNADVELGDLLIHEGAALEAQKHAARVFHADKTYFVLNGTSGANKIVLNALLSPGDLVLYERNNHKSVSFGALIQAGAIPIYLETARNPFGSIGGILEHCFNEEYIRSLIRERDPKKAEEERPIRLAAIQLGNYDGCIYNAKQIVDKIGHLCDYIFFDSAWVGYEQFIPMMRDCSPLLLDLKPTDPGIIVSQSVHKQQAGFSMASQIHKKDSHIKGQKRYLPHKRLNSSFMIHSSTSPFYQIFASLDVNAKMQEGKAGKKLWMECVENAIEARKSVIRNCHYVRPMVPPIVHGKNWEDGDTKKMANDIAYFAFEPGGKWHSFHGYGKWQYFIDPCKLQLLTPGIDIESGKYKKFGIPGIILADYLRENGIIPEKCDLNDILFLMTPAESKIKLDNLITKLVKFEELIDNDAPMEKVLPTIFSKHRERYSGYTIKQLCSEIHEFYKARMVNVLQKRLFLKEYLPEYAMSPQEANYELIRNNGEIVEINKAKDRVALEGCLPYPPGVICVQPGERWSETAVDYFRYLAEITNRLPGFSPEHQGVYLEKGKDGKKSLYVYVLKKEYDKKFSKKF